MIKNFIFLFIRIISVHIVSVKGLDTGLENMSSKIPSDLADKESMFVYVDYNYTDQGRYNVYVTAYNKDYSDNETIPYTGNEFITNYIYDKNGNLIQDSNYYYIYNKFNQLEKIKDSTNTSTVAEYFYDHNNNRILKITSNENTYYPDDSLIRVKNTTGNFDTVYYMHDDVLIARNETNTGKMFYYHPDHLGSTTLITNSSGLKEEETNYKPYGEVLLGGEDRYLFTGKELDDESDLEYFGARYYSPSLSLFVEPDSMIPDVYNPQALNRYSYVLNNPYKYVDEEGDDPKLVVAIVTIIGLRASIEASIQGGGEFISQFRTTGNLKQIDYGEVAAETQKGFQKGVLIGGGWSLSLIAATYTANPAILGYGIEASELGGLLLEHEYDIDSISSNTDNAPTPIESSLTSDHNRLKESYVEGKNEFDPLDSKKLFKENYLNNNILTNSLRSTNVLGSKSSGSLWWKRWYKQWQNRHQNENKNDGCSGNNCNEGNGNNHGG